MKKYKLKKDLPWMKEGTIFWFDNGIMKTQGMTLLAECYEATANYFFSDDDGNFSEEGFEDSDWIEEVKLREWHISESNLECFDKQYREDYYPEIKYIKVREVID